MKRKFLLFLMLLSMLFALSLGVVACVDPGEELDNVATYTVRFNDNYSNNISKVDVDAGKTVELIEEPTRTGYIFKGWYLSYEDDATEAFDATKPINENISVFAKWEKDETVKIVTLKYLNYRTLDETFAVTNGETFTKPSNPKYDDNEMYEFVAWYTDAKCTNEYDFNTNVNEDITLYAGWVQQKALIRFDANYPGAPAVTSTVVELGQPVAQPADPIREQYEFGGWYTQRIGGLKYEFDQPVDESMNIFAHWIRSEYVVTFNLNGAKLTSSDVATKYTVKRNTSAQEIADNLLANMSYVGHDFMGWYNIATDPDAEEDITTEANLVDLSSISDDMTIYAKWQLQEYEVSFDYNYDDAPEAPEVQVVKYGKEATEPTVIEREGYLFAGWFMDADYTTQFTFDMPVTGHMVLYARWVEATVEVTDVTVTYYYNVTGTNEVYATKTIEFNGVAATDMPSDPSVTDFYFAGWYTDSTYKTAFNSNMNLLENINVYAKMLKKYTFEAEATDFTGKTGQGTSTNSYEEQMIMDHTFIKGGNTQNVSNGYFVRELYSNGAYIDFEIEAAEAITDAVIFLRVSSESYQFFTTKVKDGKTYNYLSDEEFLIYLNGDINNPIKYGGLYMPMANLDEKEDLAQNKTPFEDCFIAVNVSLKKGRNVITLEVANNNNHGGTFHAEAPIIDCMYIYSSVELTMYDYEFYTKPNVQRG